MTATISSGFRKLLHATGFLVTSSFMIAACSAEKMQPVEETEPSKDERILEASDLMSDGSPIPPHRTSTIETSIELPSYGGVGGVSVDAQGNVYNTNFFRQRLADSAGRGDRSVEWRLYSCIGKFPA